MTGTKKIAKDTVYTILSLCVYNLVLQVIVYPYLCKQVGDVYFGKIVYYLSFVSLFSVSVGQSVGDEHLIFSRRGMLVFPEVLKMLCILGVFAFLSFGLYTFFTGELISCTILRVYTAACFKIQKKFGGFFLYYCILSAGCAAGLVFSSEKLWYFCFMLGEVCALLFTFLYCRSLFIMKKSDGISSFKKETLFLFLAYFVYAASLNFDRILIGRLMHDSDVSLYYVSSLMGKSVTLVIAPLNTILLSYGSKLIKDMSVKKYLKIVFGLICMVGAIFIFAYFANILFVHLFYNQLYEDAKPHFVLITASQIILFLPSMLLTLLLLLGDSKWQTIIQSIYAVSFFLWAFVFIQKWGINGAGYATIIASTVKLCFIITVTLRLLKKQKRMIDLSSSAHNTTGL